MRVCEKKYRYMLPNRIQKYKELKNDDIASYSFVCFCISDIQRRFVSKFFVAVLTVFDPCVYNLVRIITEQLTNDFDGSDHPGLGRCSPWQPTSHAPI